MLTSVRARARLAGAPPIPAQPPLTRERSRAARRTPTGDGPVEQDGGKSPNGAAPEQVGKRPDHTTTANRAARPRACIPTKLNTGDGRKPTTGATFGSLPALEHSHTAETTESWTETCK